MKWNMKRIFWFIIGTVAFLVLLSLLGNPENNQLLADFSEGFYGDVSYTCDACPQLPDDCWVNGDSVYLYDYPEMTYTGRKRAIIRTGARSGAYSLLIPPDAGYWYLRGMGSYCVSEYIQAYYPPSHTAVRQDIDMCKENVYKKYVYSPQN